LLKTVGEGGFKRVYLAFDFKSATKGPSDGFTDTAAWVGGYMKPKKGKQGDNKWSTATIEAIQHEFQFQKKWDGHEGIASAGELIDLRGQTQMEEEWILLEPYYPMDLLRFRRFLNDSELVSVNGIPKEEITFKVLKNIMAGLDLLHRNGIAHRDIKPENILVAPEKDGSYSGFITDFGISLDTREAEKEPSQYKVSGTLQFMAPETIHEYGVMGGNAWTESRNLKNDIWAMGLTLFLLEEGRGRIPSGTSDELKKEIGSIKHYDQLKRVFGIDSHQTGPVRDVILKMLHPDHEKRLSSGEALKLFTGLGFPYYPREGENFLGNVRSLPGLGLQSQDSKVQKNLYRASKLLEKNSHDRFRRELRIYEK
jgi:serine/threonine protein kinase